MNGPAIWDRLLSNLGEVDDVVRFVVVGGCVRDYALGLTPKDIDVAIPLTCRDELQEMADAIDDLPEFDGTTLLHFEMDDSYEETQAGVLVGVIDTNWTFNDVTTPVQIISRPAFIGGPEQGVSQFDWGILQMWWERGMVSVGMTERASSDLLNASATLTQREEGLIERSLERFRSFNARNPGVLLPITKGGTIIDISKAQGELDL